MPTIPLMPRALPKAVLALGAACLYWLWLCAVLIQVLVLSGCGGRSEALPAQSLTGISILVSPATAEVEPGLTQRFTAAVTGNNDTSVTWQVNNIQGGSSLLGTISSTGLYTAPATPPANRVTITAVSNADSTRSATATVKVTSSASRISVAIAPTSVTVQAGLRHQFTAIVSGTSNRAVRWSVNQVEGGNSSVGTISTTGLFVAPSSVPGQPSVSVKATSYQDSTKSATAIVVIAPPPSVGTDYYVSPGGSDSNDGSADHPWATISHAASLAEPGWVIHVAAGVYSGPITTSSSGNSSGRIRYISDAKWGAIVTCASSVPCSRVWTQKGNYVDVVGFEITSQNPATWEGLGWYGSHGLAQGNKVHDIGCAGAGSNGGDAIGTYSAATYTTINANMAYDVGLGTGYNTVHGIYINSTQYVTVSNNLVFNNEVWGIIFHHGTGPYYAKIVNNTVFNNAGGIILEGKTSSYVANNILAYNTRSVTSTKQALRECCQLNTGATNIYTHNLFYQNSSTYLFLDAAAINANPVLNKTPLFVDYTGNQNGDYRIESGSPAKDAGTSTYAPATDYSGAPRPLGAGYDIGAYEQ